MNAFPEVFTEWNVDAGQREVSSAPGMTLRDYFAAKAGAPPGNFMRLEDEFSGKNAQPKYHARWAFAFADAMLKAREQ